MNFSVKKPSVPQISEEIIAFCYLYKDKDEKNKCLLTAEHLHLIKGGRHTVFELWELREVGFQHKKILAPLVSGGISASLGSIALINYFANPWLMLSICFMGVFLFYHGWRGSPTLSMVTSIKEDHFMMRSISNNLSSFIHYVNQYLESQRFPEKRMFYASLSPEKWEKEKEVILKKGFEFVENKPLMLYTYAQLQYHRQQSKHRIFLAIDPVLARCEIRFERIGKDGLHPFAYGSITPESIIIPDDNHSKKISY